MSPRKCVYFILFAIFLFNFNEYTESFWTQAVSLPHQVDFIGDLQTLTSSNQSRDFDIIFSDDDQIDSNKTQTINKPGTRYLKNNNKLAYYNIPRKNLI